MTTHDEWQFGSLRIILEGNTVFWYSGAYHDGRQGELLSTLISVRAFLAGVEKLEQSGSTRFGTSGGDLAAIRLSQDGDTIRVSHLWDYGGYENRIPRSRFYDELVFRANQRGEEDLT